MRLNLKGIEDTVSGLGQWYFGDDPEPFGTRDFSERQTNPAISAARDFSDEIVKLVRKPIAVQAAETVIDQISKEMSVSFTFPHLRVRVDLFDFGPHASFNLEDALCEHAKDMQEVIDNDEAAENSWPFGQKNAHKAIADCLRSLADRVEAEGAT